MSKKTEEFIDKYIVGKDDWLLKHKDVIAKLLDDYETEQLTIRAVVDMRCPYCQSEDIIWHGKNDNCHCNTCEKRGCIIL